MKIYKTYRDFSDQYEQSYVVYDYYLDEQKAIKSMEKIVREEQGEYFDESQLDTLKTKGFYDVEYVGHYGIEDIEVIE